MGHSATVIAVVPLFDDGIQQVCKYLIGLLVSSHHAHGLDEGVARVVHAGLNGLVQRVAVGCDLITQLGIDGGRQVAGHAVVVLAEVRVLGTRLHTR